VTHDDALSLSMFWAGAFMVFTPLIITAVVIAFIWRQRIKETRAGAGGPPPGPRQSAER
jgi:hypothetical protein